MSFKQLGLFHRRGRPAGTGVAVGTVRQRDGLGLAFTIRPDVAQDLGWHTGDRIGVAIGEGTDEGLVALFRSPDGLRLYGKETGVGSGWGGRFTVGACHLPLELVTARVSEDVAHETRDGSLLIALPAWAYQNLPPVPLKTFRVVENRTMPAKATPPTAAAASEEKAS